MNGKINTPRTVCKAIVAVAIAAIAVAAIIGCSSLGGGSRRQSIATVIQTAYDLGGREAVSNKIESLVAEGKLSPSQAVRLHALAQLAYEGIMDDLAAGGGAATNAAPASAAMPAGTRNSERRSRRSSERRDRLFRLRRPRGGRESRPYPIVRQYAVIAVGISSGKIIIYFRVPSGYPRRITASCVPEKQSGGWSAANNRKGKRKCQKQTE